MAQRTEWLLTAPGGFGLTTASPLQRAICRIADGLPLDELAEHEAVVRALHCPASMLPEGRPHELAILAGIRGGKSKFAAALAVRSSQTCDVESVGVGPGEEPRISVVSLTKDLADVVFGHLAGAVMASPYLRTLVIGEPTTDTIRLRHPTGMPIEVKVVAGARAGASLVARWCAGVIFDEYPRMSGEDDGVINWDQSRKAVLERVLPGAFIVHIGSPWAPFGPAYEMVQSSWGKPSEDLVILRAPAFDMNPIYWTQERCEAARHRSEDVYRTDVLAEFSTPEEALFSSELLAKSTREAMDLPFEWGADYAAAMDPATRGNGWTLIVATRRGVKRRVAIAREWVGSSSAPLSSKQVLGEIAALLRPYGLTSLQTDHYYADALREIASDVGLSLVPIMLQQKQHTEMALSFRARLGEGLIELHPDPVLRADLQRLTKRVTHSGVAIVLPRSSDGRHCDYWPALIRAMSRYLDDVKLPPAEQDSVEAQRAEQARMRKLAEKQHRGRRGLWG